MAGDGFYVVAGHNPGVHGAVLTEALSSRFTFQFEVATDYDLAGVAPAEDRDVVAGTLAETFGKTVAPLALGRQI